MNVKNNIDRSLRGNTRNSHVADSIIQSLKTDKGKNIVWMIVEAEDDEKVYRKFTTSKCVVKICANPGERKGHKLVCNVVDSVYSYTKNIVGICDSDYRKYTGSYSDVSNIFYTDCRDLEMMILNDSEICDSLCGKTDNHLNMAYKTVEELARFIGYIRIYNDVKQLSIIFHNKLKVGLYWDYNKHCIKDDAKSNILGQLDIECSELDDFINEKRLYAENSFDIIRGHDMIDLLKLALVKNVYGKCLDDIYNMYGIEHFSKTNLYKNINNFALNNYTENIFI